MALKWKGRVRETSITTGTGALTLGGAVTSYGTFASLMSTGDTCYGTVAHRTATEWEDCLFTMEADGTLTRTTVIDGSSGVGVAVSLSAGTKDVFLGLPPAIVETLLGASLVTLGTAAYITSERVLTAGTNISFTDNGAGGTLVIDATGGVTDHGSLTGLADDDHTQYALLAGRATGQTLVGGTASGEDLTLQSTAHATKGSLLFGTSAYDEVNNRLGIGTTSPQASVHIAYNSGGDELRIGSVDFGLTAARATFSVGHATEISQFSIGQSSSDHLSFAWVTSGTVRAQIDTAGTGRPLLLQPGGQSAQAVGIGVTGTPAGRLEIQYSSSRTTDSEIMLLLRHQTSGTPAAGFGQEIRFQLESTTAPTENAGRIAAAWTTATHASRTSELSFSAYYTSTEQEILTLTANSAGVASSTAVFSGRPSAPFGSGTKCERFGANSGNANATGIGNTAIGDNALNAITSATYNTAVGYNAAYKLTTGSQNNAFGYGAMGNVAAIVTGARNQAIGYGALQVLTGGNDNMAVGTQALGGLATGSDNVGIGTDALNKCVSGSGNVGIGRNAGYWTTTNYNIHIGYASYALSPVSGFQDNVGIGRYALYSVTSGAGNIKLGYRAYASAVLATGSYNVLIGYEADTAAGSTEDGIALGRSAACVSNEFALGPYITAQTFYALSSTSTLRPQGKITNTWGVSTDASREGILSLYGVDYGGDRLGVQITGNGSATEIGLYATTPTIQYATTGTTTGFTAGSGTAVNDDSTFTGNTGSTAYTIGDIVRALKLLGAMAP